MDHVNAVLTEPAPQIQARAESPEVFAEGFQAAPAPEQAATEEATQTQGMGQQLTQQFQGEKRRGFDSEGAHTVRRRPHLRGAVAQIARIQAVDGQRQMFLESFHFAENEGLGEERIPQEHIGHMGQAGGQGFSFPGRGWIDLFCHAGSPRSLPQVVPPCPDSFSCSAPVVQSHAASGRGQAAEVPNSRRRPSMVRQRTSQCACSQSR